MRFPSCSEPSDGGEDTPQNTGLGISLSIKVSYLPSAGSSRPHAGVGCARFQPLQGPTRAEIDHLKRSPLALIFCFWNLYQSNLTWRESIGGMVASAIKFVGYLHSFNQQIFLEFLLCARNCSKHWRFRRESDKIFSLIALMRKQATNK